MNPKFAPLHSWQMAQGSSLSLTEPYRVREAFQGTIALSSDGLRMACGSDEVIRLWDIDHDKPLGVSLQGHHHVVLAITFSPDSKRIASGSMDHTVRIWDGDTGSPFGHSLRGHKAWVGCVAFSPDGSQIASGSEDNTIRIWEVKNDSSTDEETPHSYLRVKSPITPLKNLVPGFEECSLLHDGWVQSSGSKSAAGDKN
ncbi:hypothetical protein PIIN_10830 [Serendipita indica DSM 11827]|uniref:Uncharacterized protein n=1 Tax=Serendipita indica (strain DSM 11827) TaxID=1109443 RepID=G4TZV2_SERID|nr:hypothetical protein PIIN_10830 [Serendipita indica DSM 11827]